MSTIYADVSDPQFRGLFTGVICLDGVSLSIAILQTRCSLVSAQGHHGNDLVDNSGGPSSCLLMFLLYRCFLSTGCVQVDIKTRILSNPFYDGVGCLRFILSTFRAYFDLVLWGLRRADLGELSCVAVFFFFFFFFPSG